MEESNTSHIEVLKQSDGTICSAEVYHGEICKLFTEYDPPKDVINTAKRVNKKMLATLFNFACIPYTFIP